MSDQQWAAMLDVHVTAPFRLVRALSPLIRDAAKAEAEGGGTPRPRCILNVSSTSGTHGNAGQANYASAKAGICGLTKTLAREWGHLNVRANAIAYGFIDTRLTRAKEGGESISVAGQQVRRALRQALRVRERCARAHTHLLLHACRLCHAHTCGRRAHALVPLTRPTMCTHTPSLRLAVAAQVQLGIPGGDALRELAASTIPLARIGTADEAAGAMLMLASPWAGYITGHVLEVNGGSYM